MRPEPRRVDQDRGVSRLRWGSLLGATVRHPSEGATPTMIGTETISRVIGSDVYDEAGDKIGSASEVYLDDETGQPEWVTVRTGLFGTKESFVPIRDADLTDDGIRVPVSKDRVKNAPRIDTDGHLSPEEESELYRYYELGTGSGYGNRNGGKGEGKVTAAPRATRPGGPGPPRGGARGRG